ncbi:tRNA dihydrouridine synthase [Amphritea japonica]|uniref:tRNA-dihydrouridine(16) synthase n=1 Tax=Amphritea japonica ATCC BAA-1530 TaxID=1278309 RepID=A0A7R6PBE6_9GAMM|nr:tRNA-dihydrouridine synthase [Amphritea japonica]BBB26378.1 tRNA-dihydrouridine synthase C [Amphritea japonica ATCC BAA-1530]
MRIVLAPMEGVVDAPMREMLTRIGGIDQCVTEFVRVSERVLPAKVFRKISPELFNDSRTSAGTPVVLQLLGSDPQILAGNARKAVSIGANGIDLNFGCPAKTVNKSKGGAILLNEPELVHKIVWWVRQAVPDHIPVTAKMRLGYSDKLLALENASAIADAGACGLTVHARTKEEGYRPPAHWEWISKIREHLSIPVTANGEVWNWQDYQRCREVSGCDDVMIGRGLVAAPDLGLRIKALQRGDDPDHLSWEEMRLLLLQFLDMVEQQLAPKYVHGRIKQWLKMMSREYPEAMPMLQDMRALTQVEEVRRFLYQYS